MAVMALINCDRPVDSPAVQRGLNYLRALPPGGLESQHVVYETSLITMALCAAEQFDQDCTNPQVCRTSRKQSGSCGNDSGVLGLSIG